MKILTEERTLLCQRENEVFKRFLDRCDEAYQGSWYPMNPFKELECPKLIKEEPPEEKPEESIKPEEPKFDPVAHNKYGMD